MLEDLKEREERLKVYAQRYKDIFGLDSEEYKLVTSRIDQCKRLEKCILTVSEIKDCKRKVKRINNINMVKLALDRIIELLEDLTIEYVQSISNSTDWYDSNEYHCFKAVLDVYELLNVKYKDGEFVTERSYEEIVDLIKFEYRKCKSEIGRYTLFSLLQIVRY